MKKILIVTGWNGKAVESLDFAKGLENNAENLLTIHDKKLAKRYIKNWEEHDKHSETIWNLKNIGIKKNMTTHKQ